MTFSIWLPYVKSTITQIFGGNVSDYYIKQGLKGHPALDHGVPYGTPILNTVENCYVYALLNRENPDLGRYRAVCTLWDDPDSNLSYEVIYGHCSDIYAKVGSTPQVGTQIALVGNTGDVYANGLYVSNAEKLAGSKAGAHLHYQIRRVQRVATINPTKQYITDGNGVYKRNNTYYEVVDFGNGFNGCVDPQDYFNGFLAKDAPEVIQKHISLLSLLKQWVELITGNKNK